jgi:hypothetical protein
MKMEICFSEMSVEFQQIIRPYIPDDSTLHNHCYDNLKSYIHSIREILHIQVLL